MGIRYAEKLQVTPLLAPAASTTAKETAFVKLENMQWLSWLVFWGDMTSDSTDVMVITVKSATDQSTAATDTTQTFSYRLASAVGSDSWGAITSAATLSLGATDDNKMLIIDIDPAVIAAADTDAAYAYIDIDGTALVTNYALGVIGVNEPRYPQNANLSST